MKCPYCGAESQTRICEYCGSELEIKKEPTVVNNYYIHQAPESPVPTRQNPVMRPEHRNDAERRQREYTYRQPVYTNSGKNKWIAFALCFFLGVWGAHWFYVGKKKMGILYICTFGLFAYGMIIDLIRIACGAFTDADGNRLTSYSDPFAKKKIFFGLACFFTVCGIITLFDVFSSAVTFFLLAGFFFWLWKREINRGE